MSEQFKVGEIAIGQNFVCHTQHNGMECEIIGGLKVRRVYFVSRGYVSEEMSYRVRWANGDVSVQPPHYLLRRKPPTTGEESVLAMFKPATKREGAPA